MPKRFRHIIIFLYRVITIKYRSSKGISKRGITLFGRCRIQFISIQIKFFVIHQHPSSIFSYLTTIIVIENKNRIDQHTMHAIILKIKNWRGNLTQILVNSDLFIFQCINQIEFLFIVITTEENQRKQTA